MSRYTKAAVAFLTALGTWGYTAYSDGSVTAVEAWGLCGVLVAALSVYANPNSPPAGEPSDPTVSETDPLKATAVKKAAK